MQLVVLVGAVHDPVGAPFVAADIFRGNDAGGGCMRLYFVRLPDGFGQLRIPVVVAGHERHGACAAVNCVTTYVGAVDGRLTRTT